MKKVTKILMVVVLATFGFMSFAQTEAGKIIVAGESSLEFSATSDKWKDDDDSGDSGKGTSFDFSPQVGYFIMDNLAIGAALPISFSSYKPEGGGKSKMSVLAIAPFARYYFGASNIKPYGQALVGFGSAKSTEEPDGGDKVETKTSVFLWEVGAGVGIFLNDNVSLDIGAAYNSMSMKDKDDNPTNLKNITSGFGLKLGFTVVF